MIKKSFEQPQMKVMDQETETLICSSPLDPVNVDPDDEMEENEEFESRRYFGR